MKTLSNKILGDINLPRDRATLNAWCRSLFYTNPVVSHVIEFHTFALADNMIVGDNLPKSVESVYQKTWEVLDVRAALDEFWTVGEVFIYMDLNKDAANWERMTIQNPDYITVRRSITGGIPIIQLRPDENLRRLVRRSLDVLSPEEREQKATLDPKIIKYIEEGKNIPLNNFYESHLCNLKSPYEVRGTSMLIPILAHFRQYGADETVKQALCYPHGEVNIALLRFRLLCAAGIFKDWMTNKVFGPIAKINDFYERKNGAKSLIVPDITFDIDKSIDLVKSQCGGSGWD